MTLSLESARPKSCWEIWTGDVLMDAVRERSYALLALTTFVAEALPGQEVTVRHTMKSDRELEELLKERRDP